MSIANLRAQLARIRQSMPAVTAGNGAKDRNAGRIRAIATAPAGAARDMAIELMVDDAVDMEEVHDVELLLAAVGKDTIARVFPNGVPAPRVCAEVRAAARAYRFTGNERNPLEELIAAQIKKRDKADEMGAGQ